MMKRRFAIISFGGALLGLWATYTSCGLPLQNQSKTQNTVTVAGNPFAPNTKVLLSSLCATLSRCHAQVSIDQCQTSVLVTSGIGPSLGLPETMSASFKALIDAEASGAIKSDQASLQQCQADLQKLDCGLLEVKGAYNPSNPFSFAGVNVMVPAGKNTCAGTLTATIPVATPSPSIYGPAIAADGLANTQVGGTDCQCGGASSSAFRFRAKAPSLASVKFFMQTGPGDSAGTGGILEISVQTDDGSSNHLPSGTKLATAVFGSGGQPILPLKSSEDSFPTISFQAPAALTPGQLYHLVFKNIDASPALNFVSVESLFLQNPSPQAQPAFSNLDFGQLVNTGNSWMPRPGFTPVVQFNYGDGTISGTGYMEVWVQAPHFISGGAQVRETFTVTGTDVVASKIFLRASRSSGSSALTAGIENADGSQVAQCAIPASMTSSAQNWASCTLAAPVTLSAKSRYNLVFSAPADTKYSVVPIRKGSGYGFILSTVFADGYGQYTTGAGWSGFNAPASVVGPTEGDIQFYLSP